MRPPRSLLGEPTCEGCERLKFKLEHSGTHAALDAMAAELRQSREQTAAVERERDVLAALLPNTKAAHDRAEAAEREVSRWQEAHGIEQTARLAAEASLSTVSEQLRVAEEAKNGAYKERNQCVAFMAKLARGMGWHVYLSRHDEADADWDRDWMTIVFIETPAGQLSWHLHDSEVLPLFGDIPVFPHYKWDGHSTDEKYRRMADWDGSSSPQVASAEMLTKLANEMGLAGAALTQGSGRGEPKENDRVEILMDRPPTTTSATAARTTRSTRCRCTC
jgi:hypothetical protein